MTGIAITMMIVSMLTLWGGLGVALYNLSRHPEVDEDMPGETAPEL
ncbi:methionine/alanine import family NSS transporter small subunit [Zafaria sp. Z1313]|nr:methionine/alanine import family NSS transporter small subunit [Zafaria sp. J156]MEE1621243.1 methionine/alanine import family NSS transporter small subunit [Zafaria sp. J156]